MALSWNFKRMLMGMLNKGMEGNNPNQPPLAFLDAPIILVKISKGHFIQNSQNVQ